MKNQILAFGSLSSSRALIPTVVAIAVVCSMAAEASAQKGGNGGGGHGGGGNQELIALELCVTSVTGDINDDGSDYCHSKKDKILAIIGDKKTGFDINTSNGDNGRSMAITLEGLGEQSFSHFILNISNTDGSDFNYGHFTAIPVGGTIDVSVWVRFPADGFTQPWWWLEYGVAGEPQKPALTRDSENSFSLHVGEDVVAYLSTDQGATDLGQGSVPFDLTATQAP